MQNYFKGKTQRPRVIITNICGRIIFSFKFITCVIDTCTDTCIIHDVCVDTFYIAVKFFVFNYWWHYLFFALVITFLYK